MVLFQNRLRLDRQFIIPIITLPALLGTAAISSISLLIVTVLTLLILLSFPLFCKSKVPQTRFFFAWALTSIICLWAIFEITVPLLELLPEENLIFRICMFGSIACFYWVRKLAPLSIIGSCGQNCRDDSETDSIDQTELLMEHNEENDDTEKPRYRMRRNVSTRSTHCDICQQSILNRYHHSQWLDCCISESNVGIFLLGCGTGVFGLLFGANLALTSICHPFYFFNLFGIQILLPDDCSDVFDQYDMGLSFVGSIYAVVIGVYGLLVFISQLYNVIKHKRTFEVNRSLLYVRAYMCCYRI